MQVCRGKPAEKGKYIKIILALLTSPNTAVVYECATTLVALSQAPTAIRAAANCYCQLLVSQSDNNVKLIVLDRLQDLKSRHTDVMQDVLMDILRALNSPSIDIRRKTLDLAMELVTARNINEVRHTFTPPETAHQLDFINSHAITPFISIFQQGAGPRRCLRVHSSKCWYSCPWMEQQTPFGFRLQGTKFWMAMRVWLEVTFYEAVE